MKIPTISVPNKTTLPLKENKCRTKLTLLGTSACHLCEQAEDLLHELKIDFNKIDIAEQEEWQERYAIKIPVLLYTDRRQGQAELCWPFSLANIQNFVAINSID